MMYIGTIFGGPEAMSSRVGTAISKIKRLAGDRQVEESASLDIVFHVPGSLLTPDYEGVRTGRFSKKRRLLQVQIAVPQDLNDNDEVGQIARVLVILLREAVRGAQPVLDRAQIPYRRQEYEHLVDRVERGLSPN